MEMKNVLGFVGRCIKNTKICRFSLEVDGDKKFASFCQRAFIYEIFAGFCQEAMGMKNHYVFIKGHMQNENFASFCQWVGGT